MQNSYVSRTPSSYMDFLLSTEELLAAPKSATMQIRKNRSGEYCFDLVPISLRQRLLSLIGWGVPCEASVRNLKELIGHKRLVRIFLKDELQLDPALLMKNQVELTQDVVHRIFIGLGDIRLEDLEEKASLEGQKLNSLSVNDIDRIYDELLPFDLVEKALMNHCKPVDYHDRIMTHGKGFSGFQERVWTILTAKNEVVNPTNASPLHAKISEIEMLASRLADREPPVGSVLRLKDGYFVIDRIFAQGGAHVSVLKGVSADQSRAILLCRGTAASWNATGGYLSVLNDCLKEIGSLGIKSIWKDLKQYLAEHKILQVDILGKSLGGTHAQYLTTLIGGTTHVHVNSLSTHSSLGVPTRVQEIFGKEVISKVIQKPEILIIRSAGNPEAHDIDYIPCVGGEHLHTENTTEVYYLVPPHDTHDFATPGEGGMAQKILGFMQSFGFAHCRQNTLRPYSLRAGGNLQHEVRVGTQLEPIRNIVATFIDYITLGLVNGEPFEKFYRAGSTVPC